MSLNRAFYNYANKLFIVCNWKRQRSLPVPSQRGEAICEGQLVNIFEDVEHKNCSCSVA